MADINLTTTSTLNGGSITITVYEATGNGSNTGPAGNTYDNSASVSLSGGTETNTLSGFDGSAGNDVWHQQELTASGVTSDSPTVDSVDTTAASQTVSVSAPTSTATATTPTPAILPIPADQSSPSLGSSALGTAVLGGVETESTPQTVAAPASTATATTPVPTIAAPGTVAAPTSIASITTPEPTITASAVVSITASTASATTPTPSIVVVTFPDAPTADTTSIARLGTLQSELSRRGTRTTKIDQQ